VILQDCKDLQTLLKTNFICFFTNWKFFLSPAQSNKKKQKKTKIISHFFPNEKKKAKIDKKMISQEIYCCLFIFSTNEKKKAKKCFSKDLPLFVTILI
jgi:hypothetical protein